MKRILIAEDEERIAAFIAKGLQRNGFATAIATDGDQALLMARSGNFDLLLLDLGLPRKDGWTVLEELRYQGQQIPVIIVTACDDVGKTHDYVKKPFRFQDLLARVQSHLN